MRNIPEAASSQILYGTGYQWLPWWLPLFIRSVQAEKEVFGHGQGNLNCLKSGYQVQPFLYNSFISPWHIWRRRGRHHSSGFWRASNTPFSPKPGDIPVMSDLLTSWFSIYAPNEAILVPNICYHLFPWNIQTPAESHIFLLYELPGLFTGHNG